MATVTDHFTTVTPCRQGWLATEYKDGQVRRASDRPTKQEAEALAATWREQCDQ